jgi:hypothetical protein
MVKAMSFYSAKNVAFSGEDSVVVLYGTLLRGSRFFRWGLAVPLGPLGGF